MKTSQLAICTVTTGMLLSTSFATPVQWTIEEGGNGHWYEGVRIGYYPDGPGATWEWCREQAELAGGHLATITSQEEDEWVKETIVIPMEPKNLESGPQLGGQKVNGQWEWITDEPWEYEGWGGAEPTNIPGETRLHYWRWGSLWWDDCGEEFDLHNNTYVVEYEELPTEHTSLARAKIIAGGGYGWGIAIQQDGTLTGWGENVNNVLNLPTELTDGSRRVVKVDAWGWHAMALTEDGELFAWGKNEYGQCNIPAGLGTCIDFSAGGEHSLAVREDGTVWAWGRPDYNAIDVPPDLSGVVEIQAGNVHQIYMLEDGTIGGFGMNYNGQCNVPDGVQPPLDFDATESWSMAISDNGNPSVWGFNTGSHGGIDGCNTCIPSEATDIVDMATGHYFAMALTESGNIVAWGDNDSGQCSPPADLDEVVMIHANQDTAFAVHPDGSVTGWGNGAGADVPSDLRVWLLDEVIIDCNGNEVSDYEDIKVGYSEDLNSNYVPDECECLADVDGNNAVDTLDVLMVIARWGQPGPVGDVNYDGVVNVNDLLYVVDNWGGCPDFNGGPVEGAVQWTIKEGGNDHWYIVLSGYTWQEAQDYGISLGGHLVTLTSAEENAWVSTLSANQGNGYFHLGGFQDTSSPEYSEPLGGWRWVTNEPWEFANWLSWEPNDNVGNQNHLQLWATQWNDNFAPQTGWCILEWSN